MAREVEHAPSPLDMLQKDFQKLSELLDNEQDLDKQIAASPDTYSEFVEVYSYLQRVADQERYLLEG